MSRTALSTKVGLVSGVFSLFLSSVGRSRATDTAAVPANGEASSTITVPAAARSEEKNGDLADFKSLYFAEFNFYDGISNSLLVEGERITLTCKRPSFSKSVSFTPKEHRELLGVLRAASLPNIAGGYTQQERFEGVHESLTVTPESGVSTAGFKVENYGDNAPTGYYKISRYVRALQARKFPEFHAVSVSAPMPIVTSPTHSVDSACLTYRIGGGFGGDAWTMRIRGRTVSLTTRRGMGLQPETEYRRAVLPEKEWESLQTILMNTGCLEHPGTFIEGNLFDASTELLTLSPGPLYDPRLTILNYGDAAPRGFSTVTKHLFAMRDRIFPTTPAKSR